MPAGDSPVECTVPGRNRGTCEERRLSDPARLRDVGEGSRSVLTPRAVVFGCLMCALIGGIGPYWTFYLHTSTLFLDYSVGGAMFLLLLLVLILNGVVGRLARPLALRPGELSSFKNVHTVVGR